eukprot:Plantae.Rhodophyta-Purpureofilum_apyrenoidigerum.ctg349.p1 GENE.Plantae.Rhodophyta-Purpureofilum_apyrenoidigerum.ctg349~~Plantae.Rhodophyta-Purpureofilum_apyrenoidigerum.ctg349.p1  ORF type:complete len:428 (-),score=59.34 Plantae.Rhodophyta-Purpureofilum_apyrenoidigerum.ctg349:567-1850(-)
MFSGDGVSIPSLNYVANMPTFAREWLLFEDGHGDVPSPNLNLAICMHANFLFSGPNIVEDEHAYLPLFCATKHNQDFVLGAVFKGRSLTLPGYLGEVVEERFSFDLRPGKSSLIHSIMFDSKHIGVSIMVPDRKGNIISTVTAFYHNDMKKIKLAFLCSDKRECTNCELRDGLCDCTAEEELNASRIKREEITSQQLASSCRMGWDVFVEYGTKAFGGLFDMNLTGHDIHSGSDLNMKCGLRVGFICSGAMLERAKMLYSQTLVQKNSAPLARPSASVQHRLEVLPNISKNESTSNLAKEGEGTTPAGRATSPVVCSTCGSTFKRVYELKRHIASVHIGVKQHKCPHCGKEFFQISHLKIHVRSVHEKIRDAVCSHCLRSFVSEDKVQRHIRSVHLEERNHACTVCNKRFFRNCALKAHLRVQHNIL